MIPGHVEGIRLELRCVEQSSCPHPPLRVVCELLHKRDLKRIAESTVRRLPLPTFEGSSARASRPSRRRACAARRTTSLRCERIFALRLVRDEWARLLGAGCPKSFARSLDSESSGGCASSARADRRCARSLSGFAERGFNVTAVYTSTKRNGKSGNTHVRPISELERDAAKQEFDIAVVATRPRIPRPS